MTSNLDPDDDEETFGTPESGLVQILGTGGTACGMGFLLSRTDVVTCAHVVNDALGLGRYNRVRPASDASITVAFPLAEDDVTGTSNVAPTAQARIVEFRPPGRLPHDDVALLRLSEAAPEEVGVTVLADIRGVPLDGDDLDVFGPPAGSTLPIHCDARFAGKVNQAWTQIDSVGSNASFVSGGFSGGRVWSHPHEAAVGMIVAKHDSETFRRAFMIPASAILRFVPGIPGETRRVGRGFGTTWTVFSTIFLLLILTHFLGERIGNYPSVLALGNGNPTLNGFFGMHFNAILMPIALLMCLRFARGFKEHPWWMRLPAFGLGAGPAKPTASRITCLTTLCVFVFVPIYLQSHFIRRFNSQGYVYIYPADFGFTVAALSAEGQFCDVRSVERCTHPCAGRYSLVTPGNGAKGGYVDNAYHYGDLKAEKPNSVTFFPILQPLAIYALSAWSLVLAVLLTRTIFQPPSRSRRDA